MLPTLLGLPAVSPDAAGAGRPEGEGSRRQRFLLRLVAGCLCPLSVAVICQATYSVVSQRQVTNQGLADKASSMAALMVNVAGPAIAFDDNRAVADALAFVTRDPDFEAALAFDAAGNVIAYRGREAARAGFVAQARLGTGIHVDQRPDMVVASYPIWSGGKVIGTVQVVLSTARAAGQIRRVSLIAVLISVAGVAVAVLVVLALAMRIARRNRDMVMLLDAVEQGFLGVDGTGTLAVERSAVAAAWLGPYRPGQKLWEAVKAADGRAGEWVELAWANLEGGLPVEVCLDQFPKRLVIGDRIVRLEIKPVMQGEELRQALVVLSDITAEIERERAQAIERDLLASLERMTHDRGDFFEFLEETDRLVHGIEAGFALIRAGHEPDKSFRLDLHTLKGNAAVSGLHHLARSCHEVEERIRTGMLADGLDAGEALLVYWHTLHRKLRQIAGTAPAGRLEVHLRDVEALESRLLANAPAAELLGLVRAWQLEPLDARFDRLAMEARELAGRLGKGDIDVRVDTEGLRLDRERWLPFWRVFGHVLRNAVDHGLEPPADRAAAGKRPAGTIHLRAREDKERLVIEVEDDGRGIDWARLAERARSRGLPAERPEDLVDALFAEGVTTRDDATETSGRGVGLTAVRAACQQLGLDVTVASVPGRGTTVRFSARVEEGAAGRALAVTAARGG